MDTPNQLDTVHARMTAANIPSDVDPLSRVEAVHSDDLHTVAAHSQLERMLHALQPLHVARESSQGPVSTRPPSGATPRTGFDLIVRGRLGEGGMGVVELAEQRSLGREVALKRLHAKPAHEAEGYALLDEARIHGSLEHPNVAPVHAVGADQEFGPVVVLKRVTGQTWGTTLRADAAHLPQEPDALERHLRVLMQVSNALDYAHSRGVLHRDVKPENVMLGEFGEVYLMDWGLALRRDGLERGASLSIAGTPAYMAPEMVRGDADAIDQRTDVFLLGAALHQVLTGLPRHLAATTSATMLRALHAEPCVYAPEVPVDLGAIANRACAADPNMRFESARAFREALEGFLALRETHALVASAEALLETEGHGDPRPFYQAQFVLEQALRARPGLPSARRALTRCRGRMFDHALLEGDLRRAEALLAELGDAASDAQREALAVARREQEAERARIADLERDADPRLANAVRLRGVRVAFTLLVASQAAQLIADPSPGFTADPKWLLYTYAVASALIVIFLATRARALSLTAIDRQFLQLFTGVAVAGLASRAAGLIEGADVPTILTRDTFLFAAVIGSVRVPLPHTWLLGLLGLGLGLLSVTWPEVARYLHMLYLDVVVLSALLDITREARQFARTPAPPTASVRPPR